MITILVFPLADTLPAVPMFKREFAERLDADRYEAFMRGLGACHIRRSDAAAVPPPPHVDEQGKVTYF